MLQGLLKKVYLNLVCIYFYILFFFQFYFKVMKSDGTLIQYSKVLQSILAYYIKCV